MKLRELLYKTGRILSDMNAVKKNRIPRRMGRRLAGKAAGKIMRKVFR